MPSARGSSFVIEHPLAHERLRHADAGRVGERAQSGGRAGAGDAVAGEHDRALGAADHAQRRLQLLGAGLGPAAGTAHRQRLGVDLRRHHILRQLDVRRPGFCACATLNALRTTSGITRAEFSRALNFVTAPACPPGRCTGATPCVSLQVGLAGEGDQRRAVEPGVGDAGHQVRSRRGRGCGGRRRPTVSRPTFGHIGAALLVADGHELDRRGVQRLVEIERLLTRDAEDVPGRPRPLGIPRQVRRRRRPPPVSGASHAVLAVGLPSPAFDPCALRPDHLPPACSPPRPPTGRRRASRSAARASGTASA